MKRILSLIFVLSVMLAAIAIPASAASVTQNFVYEFVDDYTRNVGNSAGYVQFRYIASFFSAPDAVTTNEYVPTGGTGWVYCFITRQYRDEVEAYSAQDTSISNNALTCTAQLNNYSQATKSNHFASRTINGTTDTWDYYFESQYHGYGVDYNSLSNSVKLSLETDSK